MDDESKYDYWNQPADYNAGQNQDNDDKYDYDPEEEKGDKNQEADKLEKDLEGELDSQMPTFMNDEVSD
jgi:hypothetical protein